MLRILDHGPGCMHAVYPPASRFWLFQGIETTLFASIAILLIAFAAGEHTTRVARVPPPIPRRDAAVGAAKVDGCLGSAFIADLREPTDSLRKPWGSARSGPPQVRCTPIRHTAWT